MSFITDLATGGVQGVLSGANSILGRFVKDKDKAEANTDTEQMAASGEFSSEFQDRTNRTWWDSFVDGLNRLPRPIIAFGAIGVLVWAPYDPVSFSAAMVAYTLMPPWMTIIIGQIILLFFGGRMLANWGDMKGQSPAQVKQTLETISQIKALGLHKDDTAVSRDTSLDGMDRQAASLSTAKPFESDADFKADFANTKKPLTNASILEWNRRRQAKAQ